MGNARKVILRYFEYFEITSWPTLDSVHMRIAAPHIIFSIVVYSKFLLRHGQKDYRACELRAFLYISWHMSFGLGVQTLLPFWPDLKGGPLVALAALEVFRDFPAIPRSSLRKVTTVRDQQNDSITAQR